MIERMECGVIPCKIADWRNCWIIKALHCANGFHCHIKHSDEAML